MLFHCWSTVCNASAALGQRLGFAKSKQPFRPISPISQIVIFKKYEMIMKHSHIDIKVKIRFRSLSTSLNNVISFSLHMLDDIYLRTIKHVIICEVKLNLTICLIHHLGGSMTF